MVPRVLPARARWAFYGRLVQCPASCTAETLKKTERQLLPRVWFLVSLTGSAMSTSVPPFHEAHLRSTPMRDLHLKIEGTPLEPIIEEFQRELDQAGIRKLRPHFYLST